EETSENAVRTELDRDALTWADVDTNGLQVFLIGTAPTEASRFQALSAALSATVGLGNIAGVAIAICLGGPGAAFWMILMGFFGMTSKFCECTLGVKYRKINPDGSVAGGAMYYLSRGLAERGLGGLGKVLAVFFALMCIGGALGAGNMFQVNQAYIQFSETTGLLKGQGWVFGLIVAILVGAVIIFGIKGIAKVTSKLVPFMCIIYLVAALVVILMNIGGLPAVIGRIFTEAFAPTAVAGGLVGVLIQGIKRAAFSNEAGVGSAPIAHAAVKTDKPASEGLVALLEPFIDTVIVCTMTACVILITGTYDAYAGQDNGWVWGVKITSEAFADAIPFFPWVLMLAVVLFAFSTMISWSYYGEKAITYLAGENKGVMIAYRLIFCTCTVIGASASLGNVLRLSDAMFFAMVIPNLIGIYLMLPVVKGELNSFIKSANDQSK
ncbi:MAG: alanine/glycine:cation symporter family protein, partial [Verrucomicrobiota bacterium]